MVRVLFYTGCIALAVSAAFLFLPALFAYILCAGVVLATIICFIFKRKIKVFNLLTMLVLISMICISGCFKLYFNVSSAKDLDGQVAVVEGYVCDDGISEDTYTAFTVLVNSITTENKSNYVPPSFKVKIYDDEGLLLSSYKDILFTARLNDIDKSLKPSNYADGVYMTASLIKINSISEADGFHIQKLTHDTSYAVKDILDRYLNFDDAALSKAIMLGDSSALDDDFYASVRASGVSHMLVVSGMHLAIITILFLKLFNKIKMPYHLRYALLLVFTLFIMTTCGFSKSVMRAGITLIIFLAGKLMFKESDPLVSLGAATTFMVIVNPFLFGSVGYLLSFSSTFGIIWLSPRFLSVFKRFQFNGIFYKLYLIMVEILAQTLGALFVSLPILMFYFSSVSVAAPLTNLILCYPVTLVLWLLVFGALLSFVPVLSYFCPSLFIISSYLLRFIRFIINRIGMLPWAVLPSKDEYYFVWIILAFAFIILVILRRFKDYKSARIISAVSIIISFTISISVVAYSLLSAPDYTNISVVKCRYGASVIVNRGNDVLIVDAGESEASASRITYALQNLGKRSADVLLLPYDSQDTAAAGYLADKIDINQIYVCGYEKDENDIRNSLPENTEIVYDNYSGKVGDISYRATDEILQITVKGKNIVISANQDLEPGNQDIFIARGYIPENIDADNVYVCGNNIKTDEVPPQFTQITHTFTKKLFD